MPSLYVNERHECNPNSVTAWAAGRRDGGSSPPPSVSLRRRFRPRHFGRRGDPPDALSAQLSAGRSPSAREPDRAGIPRAGFEPATFPCVRGVLYPLSYRGMGRTLPREGERPGGPGLSEGLRANPSLGGLRSAPLTQ